MKSRVLLIKFIWGLLTCFSYDQSDYFLFLDMSHTVFIRLSKKKDYTYLIKETAWPCWPCAETGAYRIGVLTGSRGNCGGSHRVPPYESLFFLPLLLACLQFVVFLLLNLSSFKSIPFIECCCASTYCQFQLSPLLALLTSSVLSCLLGLNWHLQWPEEVLAPDLEEREDHQQLGNTESSHL